MRLPLALGGDLDDARRTRTKAALRFGLGLTEDEVERLLALGTFELELRPMADLQRQRLLAGLEGMVWLAAAPINHEACPKHSRLSTHEICPRCGGRTCGACRHLTKRGSVRTARDG